MVHTETQQYETTIQITVLAPQDPTNTTAKTAGDIANLMAYILQNEVTIQSLRENGIGFFELATCETRRFPTIKSKRVQPQF